MEAFFEKVYYDSGHAAAYASVAKLRRAALDAGFHGASWKKTRDWLASQETYSLYKRIKRKFLRNSIPLVRLHYQWESDLMDMQRYASANEGYKYVLCLIDNFSKYAWTVPLKSKTGAETAKALDSVFAKGIKPTHFLRSDKGKEYLAKPVKAVLEKYGIKQMLAQNESKAAIVERFIKTLKMKITKEMYRKQSHRYVDSLEKMTAGYNASIHSSTGFAPEKVTIKTQGEVLLHHYNTRRKRGVKPPSPPQNHPISKPTSIKKEKKKKRRKPFLFKVDDLVRVSYTKHIFTREYDEHFSHELFKVSKRYRRERIPVYKIKEFDGKEIIGVFYQQELTLAFEPDAYKVDEVLKKRKVKGKTEYLVSYKGWPKKYASWVNSQDLGDV